VPDILLLEVAVGNIVVAPVGDRIELQTVGELHLVGLAKLLELLAPLAISFPLGRTCGGLLVVLGKFGKLYGLLARVVTVKSVGVQGCVAKRARKEESDGGRQASDWVMCDCGSQRRIGGVS
jgi:hypothetical protein